jgi:hypothetical protein
VKLKFALSTAAILMLAITGAVAQAGLPPPSEFVSPSALHAEIKADVAEIRANAKAGALTRQQIQQLRRALRAKLLALRH